MNYFLINNTIKKGGEMPLEKDYDSNAEYKHYYNLWLSSLQPCEINSYESMLINKYLLQNGFVLNNNPNPIDVTDIVEERNHTQLLRNPPIDKFELFFKQPKQVDSEIEAVEYAETISNFADKVIQNHKEVYEKYPYWTSTDFIKSAIISVQLVIDNNPKTVSAIGYGSAQFSNPKISFMNDVIINLKSRLPKS